MGENHLNKCFSIKGKTWKSRGLRDLAKHLHIADCVREHELDFVAITESGRQDFLVLSRNCPRNSGSLEEKVSARG